MYPFKTFYSLKKPSEVVKKHFTKLKIILIHASNIERYMCCSMEIENFIQALEYCSVGHSNLPVLPNFLVIQENEVIVTKHITTLD